MGTDILSLFRLLKENPGVGIDWFSARWALGIGLIISYFDATGFTKRSVSTRQ